MAVPAPVALLCCALLCGCNSVFGIRPPVELAADSGASGDAVTDDVDPSPSGCRQSGGMFTDPNTGVTWTLVWFCGNEYEAPVFAQASTGAEVATMSTVESWFACYRHGEPHQGGNDVWYYTQGDKIQPGWEARKAWGFMPAYAVRTHVDPIPGMVECRDQTTPPR
jgi:hypothetical protein